MKTLLLIDANSLIHRTFHALPPLTTPDGRPAQALYGLSSVLLKMWREDRPDYVAALFDRPEPTFRKEKYREYKAQRPETPDNLVEQLIEAHNLFNKFGIKTFEKPGYEADDLIATLATKFYAGSGLSSGRKDERDLKIVILTGDLDTLQLVEGDKLVVRTFRRGISDTFVYDEPAVKDRYGLEPKQLIDYKALVGDASDNIKGVSGIGEKTATALLQKYGTLENIYRHLSDDPKMEKKLKGTKKEAEFSRDLVILNKKAPIKIGNLEDLKVVEFGGELREYFSSLGFESLVKRLQAVMGDKGNKEKGEEIKGKGESGGLKKPPTSSQGSMFATAGAAAGGASASNQKRSKNNGTSIFFVLEPEYDDRQAGKYASDKLKVGFDLKKLAKEAWKKGEKFLPPYFDLGVAFWILDSDFKDYGPRAAFKHFLNKKWAGEIGDLERAYEFCSKEIKSRRQEKIFFEIEMPLIKVLAKMENFGIGVSFKKLEKLEEKINEELKALTGKIYKLSGEKFNINSPKQLSEVLFKKLKLEEGRLKKTAGGAISTREEVLLNLRGRHKIIDLILEYREVFKLLTTYVRPFQDLAREDGKIHTDYIQTGTATGRLSSREPNMQNIPKAGGMAPDLRAVFEASGGNSFVSFDYSQIELRALAAMTKDKNMIKAFLNDQDIHSLTASRVLGIPLGKVSSHDRRLAKTLNFGLIYGMGVTAFSRASGLPRKKAQEFIDAYFREFSAIKIWQEEVKKEARRKGYAKTMTGRRRYLRGLDSGIPRFVAEAERVAINMPLQGLAADIIKMAMIKADEELAKSGWQNKGVNMLLTIHDELLFEVPDDMIRKTAEKIKEIMENVFKFDVPLKVDVSAGKNLGEMKKLEI